MPLMPPEPYRPPGPRRPRVVVPGHHAVPVALARLVDRLGLTTDPLAMRGVSLIVRISAGAAPDDIAAVIVDRHIDHASVVAVVDGQRLDDSGTLHEISCRGITVRASPIPVGGHDGPPPIHGRGPSPMPR